MTSTEPVAEQVRALQVAHQQAVAAVADLESAVAQASQRAQAALAVTDFDAADRAHAERDAAAAALPSARATEQFVGAALRAKTEEMVTADARSRRDTLNASVQATRLELSNLIEEFRCDLRAAQSKLQIASQLEAQYADMQRALHDVDVQLGDRAPDRNPVKELPVDHLIAAHPLVGSIFRANLVDTGYGDIGGKA